MPSLQLHRVGFKEVVSGQWDGSMDKGTHTYTRFFTREATSHTRPYYTLLPCLTDPWHFFLCSQLCSPHACFFSVPNWFLLFSCSSSTTHPPRGLEPKLSRNTGQETSGWRRGCGASGQKTGPEAEMLNGASASRNGRTVIQMASSYAASCSEGMPHRKLLLLTSSGPAEKPPIDTAISDPATQPSVTLPRSS